MEGMSLKYNFASFSTNTAQLDCSFEISDLGKASIHLFATDPRNRRKAGIFFSCNNHVYGHLKQVLQHTEDTIGKLRSSGQLNQLVALFQEKPTIEMKTGSVFTVCGQFDFHVNIMPNKCGYIVVYTFDPSNLRKSGVTFFLDDSGFSNFKHLTKQIDDFIASLLHSNQLQHTSFYETGTCLSTHCPDCPSYSFYQQLRSKVKSETPEASVASPPQAQAPGLLSISSPAPAMRGQPMIGNTSSFRIVCPNCEAQNLFELSRSVSSHDLTCPQCQTAFLSNIVKVRSKNSRGNKKYQVRGYSIRVIDSAQQEHLIEFETVGYSVNFDLRSRDDAVFTYYQNKLALVQNLTIGQYMKVSAPFCYIATYVYGQESFEVALLRQFRDTYLLPYSIPSKLVSLYYWLSPIAISKFGPNLIFRMLSKLTLRPITLIVGGLMGRNIKPKFLNIEKP